MYFLDLSARITYSYHGALKGKEIKCINLPELFNIFKKIIVNSPSLHDVTSRPIKAQVSKLSRSDSVITNLTVRPFKTQWLPCVLPGLTHVLPAHCMDLRINSD